MSDAEDLRLDAQHIPRCPKCDKEMFLGCDEWDNEEWTCEYTRCEEEEERLFLIEKAERKRKERLEEPYG